MNITPLAGYVIIEPQEQETKTASGIYLPDDAKQKMQYGKVIAVGADAMQDGQKVTSPVKKGDVVIYKQWGGTEIEIDGNTYNFLKFEDLLGIMK